MAPCKYRGVKYINASRHVFECARIAPSIPCTNHATVMDAIHQICSFVKPSVLYLTRCDVIQERWTGTLRCIIMSVLLSISTYLELTASIKLLQALHRLLSMHSWSDTVPLLKKKQDEVAKRSQMSDPGRYLKRGREMPNWDGLYSASIYFL